MKKFVFFAILTLGLLTSISADARVQNYIYKGDLYVWWNGHYENMGPYTP